MGASQADKPAPFRVGSSRDSESQAPPGTYQWTPGQHWGPQGQGAAPSSPPYVNPQQGLPQVTNQKAILSLVLGVSALLVPIPYVLGIIAIVLGNQARPEIRNDASQTGDGLALAGLILGWIDIALSTFMVLVWLMIFGMFGTLGGW